MIIVTIVLILIMESQKKEQYLKLALAALGLSISAYVIYKLTRPTQVAVEQSPFRDIIDQRAT